MKPQTTNIAVPRARNKQPKLKNLEILSHSELSQEWKRLVGNSPPKASSRKFLLRSLACEIQMKQSTGLSKANLKNLSVSLSQNRSANANQKAKSSNAKPRIKLVPGSRLVREWNGKTYTVSVIEEGFVYRDKVWASLSAIARDITSAHWSGPRFFGVKGVV